jgi:NADH:ubiquinone oxidoreductase subunit 4 (subunit M)
MLWMLRSVNFGDPPQQWLNADLEDVNTIEWIAWAPLVVGIIAIGIYPKIVLGATDDAVVNLVQRAFGG